MNYHDHLSPIVLNRPILKLLRQLTTVRGRHTVARTISPLEKHYPTFETVGTEPLDDTTTPLDAARWVTHGDRILLASEHGAVTLYPAVNRAHDERLCEECIATSLVHSLLRQDGGTDLRKPKNG